MVSLSVPSSFFNSANRFRAAVFSSPANRGIFFAERVFLRGDILQPLLGVEKPSVNRQQRVDVHVELLVPGRIPVQLRILRMSLISIIFEFPSQ